MCLESTTTTSHRFHFNLIKYFILKCSYLLTLLPSPLFYTTSTSWNYINIAQNDKRKMMKKKEDPFIQKFIFQ